MALSDEEVREQFGYSGKSLHWQRGFDAALQDSRIELQHLRKRIEAAELYIELLEFESTFDFDDTLTLEPDLKQTREEWLKTLPEPPKDKP